MKPRPYIPLKPLYAFAGALAALLLSGCAHLNPATNASNFHRASGGIAADLVTVMNELVAIEPGATSIPRVHIESAKAAVKSAQGHLQSANKSYDELSADDTKTHDALTKERNHWAGYKLRVLGWWTLAIVALVIVAIITLNVLSGLSGGAGIVKAIGVVAKGLFHTLTLGTAWIAAKSRAWVKSKVLSIHSPLVVDAAGPTV